MFCYLGSRVTCKNTLDDELTARLAKAGTAFGQLSRRLWKDRGIRLDTKIQVYQTAILSSLLYGSETWTPYRRHVKKLDNFHMNLYAESQTQDGRTDYPTQKSLTAVILQALKLCACSRSYVGAPMSTECRTAAYQSNYCTVN